MEPSKAPKVRIGDLLVSKGLIVDEQLKQALNEQKRTGKKIGKVVIDLGFVTESQMLQTMANHFGYPFVDLARFRLNNELIKVLPETYARRFRAILLAEQPDGILVGMLDPLDLIAIDELQRILKRPVHPAFVKEQELLSAMDRSYRRSEQIASIAVELDSELESTDFDLESLATTTDTAEAPVVRLLQSIFEDAVQVRASDIHIEPDEQVLRVRLRIDGELQEQVMKERRIAPALVSRLKIMSGLDISEKRLPQDGRFNVRVMGKSIDVRLSTLPVPYGECVVMRLLDQSAGMLSMDKLGMPETIRKRFENLIQRPYGMVLVTGPTGSGKTTTLYAALSMLNVPERKVITAEDPIEYRLPRINQVQVSSKIGLTFSSVLRTALRQDPDVILVGEMRDHETAEIGLRAAMTGHMVLSTLHTNDSISTAMRLIDMGCDAFLVASSLRAVIAQRLVRKICEHCTQPYKLSPQELTWLGNIDGTALDAEYHKGSGCHHCNNTGYSGRVGVYELLEMDENLLYALRKGDAAEFARAAADNPNFRSLSLCTLDYARTGITSVQEVFKITATLDDG
ncbi:MAG: MSHA biogenesis protein MshE [Pseudomonadales bacterium]|nr:MSHA biogenesis protein MshE [Pseudomonadales bacterium]TNC85002.1 MAG: MSHA biogenesis protein MshE [Alcanivorax sp.]HAG95319.1 MSHA biogenesis protein MshE [Gammaproteobacteria bacterium]MAQ26450.1 MSHA biogenesis protein MshE [Pseudomonadales bacterium]MAQ27574.1 MSHA biogenesis protein MshE [Pseudomonadales bacterium]|tara:strand:- start:1680 stop:3389 length:1710 start_codon:yes stop_codon:yes gene_type:complete